VVDTISDNNAEIANGGAGLICFGNIPVDRYNLENYNNAVLDQRNPWNPVEAFKPAIRAAKSRGALCLPQLQFPGRQVPEFINRHPKSASDVQLEPCLNKTYGKPMPLAKQEIKELIGRYVWAAQVLQKAGADGIIVSDINYKYKVSFNLTIAFANIQLI
jgi:2,4-dienoyl-CoA reductase-like NADH-dependent reductase (Old Yellow Enzyme family)